MKKSLLLILAVAGLLAGSGLEAFRGGRHRGGHRGHGRRHGGWGRRGWGGPGFGLGISVGGPRYYEPAPVVYISDPMSAFWAEYPDARNISAYKRWLRSHGGQLTAPWRSYYTPYYREVWKKRYHRRWGGGPRVGFGVGFGF